MSTLHRPMETSLYKTTKQGVPITKDAPFYRRRHDAPAPMSSPSKRSCTRPDREETLPVQQKHRGHRRVEQLLPRAHQAPGGPKIEEALWCDSTLDADAKNRKGQQEGEACPGRVASGNEKEAIKILSRHRKGTSNLVAELSVAARYYVGYRA